MITNSVLQMFIYDEKGENNTKASPKACWTENA